MNDFTAGEVQSLLEPAARGLWVTVEDCVDSTNTVLKSLAEAGGREGEVLIARRQTAGKGRLGRSFFSPKGTGLYMSVLLRPALAPEHTLFITTAAAVAVAGAVEAVTGRKAGIKWVNDVYLDCRKICGILTEGAMDFAQGRLRYAVLGIGVNLAPPPGGFPEELRSVAGAVFSEAPPEDVICRLAAEILNRFSRMYRALPDTAFLEEYRARSVLTGLTVTVVQGAREVTGQVLGVDNEARLVLRRADGREEAFASGEATLKKGFLRQLRERTEQGEGRNS